MHAQASILSGPAGLPVFVLLTDTQEISPGEQGRAWVSWTCWPRGWCAPGAGAWRLRDAECFPTLSTERSRCCFVLKGPTPANRRYLRPPSPSVSSYNPAGRLKDQGLCQGHPSSWRQGWTRNGGLLALRLRLSSAHPPPLKGLAAPKGLNRSTGSCCHSRNTPFQCLGMKLGKGPQPYPKCYSSGHPAQAWGLGRLAQVPSACRAPRRVLLYMSSFCGHKLGGCSTHFAGPVAFIRSHRART